MLCGGGKIVGIVGQGDTLLIRPTSQHTEKHPELLTGAFAFALDLLRNDKRLIIAAEDAADLPVVERGAEGERPFIVPEGLFTDLAAVLGVPTLINVFEGHIILVRNGNIRKAVKGFLRLGSGGESSNADTVLSGHPGLYPVTGEFADAAGTIGALSVFALLSLLLTAYMAELSAVGQLRFAFDT